jgi:hypothetical protein
LVEGLVRFESGRRVTAGEVSLFFLFLMTNYMMC